jgi:acetyltransferase-like isoleucine patch superfamily enzyme
MLKVVKDFIKRLSTLTRKPFLALRGNKVSVTSLIRPNSFFRGCKIGKWCFIGPNGVFNNVHIGNYTCIAPACQIGGEEHSYWTASISPKLSDECISDRETHIGHDVWIAADCVIRQGVTIGDGAVVGAHSFVNKDVPPYAIVFGSPAKFYRFRFDEATIKQLNDSHYWDYEPKKARKILEEINVKNQSG